MTQMLAISMRVSTKSAYNENRDAIAQDWWSFLSLALPDMHPLMLPNDPLTTKRLLDAVKPDGLLLTGGNDIGDNENRDQSEAVALTWMITQDRPVIGICRGMQFIARHLGCALRPISGRSHAGVRHPVRFEEKILAAYKLPQPTADVNSYHHHEAELSGNEDLIPFAWSDDGVVEGVVSLKKQLLGIMWHPEREKKCNPCDLHLFKQHFSSGGGKQCGL